MPEHTHIQLHRTSMLSRLALIGLAAVLGCDGDNALESTEILETRLAGSALLNTSGARVEARTFQDDALVGSPTETDTTGRYQLRLQSLSGDLVVKACGGSYVDPVTGNRTDVGEDCLHALAQNVDVCEEREVHVSPFSELLYSYARARGIAAASILRTHLEGWMGSDDATSRSAVFADPTEEEGGNLAGPRPATMSYLVFGGISQLAHDLSVRFGLQPGTRLSTMRLVKLLSEDISDGSIDGHKNGVQLMAADRRPLPADVLRQELAQAIHRFTGSDKNRSGVTQEVIVDALSSISTDRLPALGPDGIAMDREAPTTEFTGLVDGSIVVSDMVPTCQARDRTGVRMVTLEAHDLERDTIVQRAVVDRGHNGSTMEEAAFPLPGSTLPSGRYRLRCQAEDIWGNVDARSILFSINRGETLPEIAMVPPLTAEGDDVRGSRTIQCIFDDPHVVEIQAVMEGTTRHIEFPRVQGRRAASYHWDSSGDLDGFHTVRCLAWTTGHTAPRAASMRIRVANSPRGLAAGRVFLGAPTSDMEISAYKWERGSRGERIGGPATVSPEEGAFELPLSNEYRGPIVLEAGVAAASERPTMESFIFHGHHQDMSRNLGLSLVVSRYEPGQRLESLPINAATSLATALFEGKQSRNPHGDMEDAWERSVYTVGQIVSPGGHLDLVSAHVPDLRTLVRGADSDRVALGLFHGGLATLAAEESLGEGHGPDASTIADVLACVREDIRSGELNGHDTRGRVTRSRFNEGGPDMLRYNLARATYSWLRSTGDEGGMRNRTGISYHDAIRSGWLQAVSIHDHAIFGEARGTSFDAEGPEIAFECKGQDGRQEDCQGTFGGLIVLRVISRDAVGIRRTEVFQRGGASLSARTGGTPEVGEYDINVPEGFHGQTGVVVRSWDALGNVNERSIDIRFDRRPVTMATPNREYLTNREGVFDAPVISTKELVKLTISGEKLAREATAIPRYELDIPASREFRAPLRLPPEDGLYRFEVTGEDALGNKGFVTLRVVLNTGRLELGCSRFMLLNREDGSHTMADFDRVTRMVFYDIDMDPYRWSRSMSVWPKLQFWSKRNGRDTTEAGQESVRLAYRYSLNDRGVRREGAWKDVADRSLELNYKTMLVSLHDIHEEELSAADNIIYHASAGARHRLEIRATDDYGNDEKREWEYSMRLFPPPLEVWVYRKQPAVDQNWRDFVRGCTRPGGESDLVMTANIGDGSCFNETRRVFGQTLLPENIGFAMRMDDIIQFWRVNIDGHLTRMMQFSNFTEQRDSFLLKRGMNSVPLTVTTVWDEPALGETFSAKADESAAFVERRLWVVGADSKMTIRDWRTSMVGQEPWSWDLTAHGQQAEQGVPEIRPCRFSPLQSESEVSTRFWSPGMQRVSR